MNFVPSVAASAVFASGLCAQYAQYFVEHERSLYPDSPPSPSTYNGSNSLVIDVDGDGHPDVLAGGSAANSTNCYRNDGHGRFRLTASGLATPSWVLPQAIGDYDGDGLPDYCTGGSLMRNQGGGVFVADPALSIFTFAEVPGAFLDYDGDGDLDWLANNGSLMLYANDGTGTFTQVTASVLAGFDRQVQSFRVVDLDHDGDLDIVKSGGGFGPTTLRVWRNQGGGVFTEETLPAPAGLGAFSNVHVADFDGDGSLDIAIQGLASTTGSSLGFWLVTGTTGAWTMTPFNFTANEVSDLVNADAGDWDGDGRADWVSRTGIYLQTAPMQFVFQPMPGGNMNNNPLLIDLDGDGRLDVIAARTNGFLRNLATGPLPSERPWVSPANASSVAPKWAHGRQRSASPPIDDVLFAAGSSIRLGSDEPIAGEVDRTWRFTTLPGSDATFVSPTAGGTVGIVTVPGPSFFDLVNGVPVPASAPTLPALPSQVRAADLDGLPGDELVFGSPTHSGPMIFTRSGAGWVDVSPVVPATPTAPPTHEQIQLVDFDGDGDLDIVHESRWLRNDNGSWAVMGSFASLVLPSATCIAAIDCDGDGHRDLFLGAAAGASRVLRNTGTGFVNDTNAWLPAGLGAVSNAIVEDVDHDGRDDLLLVIGTRSHLLRNSGTTFTLVPDIGPAGALVDLDHDGRHDLFTGTRILWNSEELLWTSGPPLLGSWLLHYDRRDTATPLLLGMLLISHGEAATPWPGVGTVYVDPTGFASFLMYVLAGSGEADLPIPASTALVGQPLRGQVLAWDFLAFHLSNLVRGVIH